MINEPFVIQRTFNASVEKVWKAITDKSEMKKWYFDIAEFKLQVGFEFRFIAGNNEKKWLHICKITEIVQEKKLTYSWRYDGYNGISYVTFELYPEGSKTRLKLTHSDLESFPQDVPEFKKENFAEGWNYIVGTSLKEYLEKKESLL